MSAPVPKRRLDVHTSDRRRGGRRAERQRGLSRFIPSPAFAGALVLIAAGAGTIGVSPQLDTDSITANYQAIGAGYAGTDPGAVAGTTISRTFDRSQTKKQVQAQTKQLQQALATDTAKVQKRADQLKSHQWVLPVTGYHLTARFGESSGLWASTHTGLDFAGPSGSTIVSVAGGTVKSAEFSGAYGNRTIVELDDGTEIWYCHQSDISVSPGDSVEPGDVIGYTGSTGNATGPHLHLEVHPDGGDPVDPYEALVSHNVQP